MTQHDMDWADQLFPPMRADMNQALAAISTRQAGTGAPALAPAAQPNRVYVDISRKQVLTRNNDNTIDYITDSWAQNKFRMSNGDETLFAEDVNRAILVGQSVAKSLFLPQAVGNFAENWNVDVYNLGPAILNIIPTAPSQLNNTGGITLEAGQGAKVFSITGTYWAIFTGKGNAVASELTSKTVPTGTIFLNMHQGIIPPGYVRLLGGTMGNASSGASERASSDTWALYSYVWSLINQTNCPVNGGRSASWDVDYNRNAWITLPDLRGRTVFGTDLGAGRLVGGTPQGINGNDPGKGGGSEAHVLTEAEMPVHSHDAVTAAGLNGPAGTNSGNPIFWYGSAIYNGRTGGAGANYQHNNVPPGMAFGCWIAKL